MGYVLIGILFILVLAAGVLIARRNMSAPFNDNRGDASAFGDTTEHSDVPTPPRTGRRG